MKFLEKLNRELKHAISAECEHYPEKTVIDAMLYSVLSGGKRVRGSLVRAFAVAGGAEEDEAIAAAAAIEMVHAYSLIHDDLPAMDNDDYRRGKPSCHKAFGEATAILAGDALLTLAFKEISTCSLPDSVKVKLITSLSTAAGAAGMIGGQQADIYFENKKCSMQELRRLQNGKTGALIKAACEMGVYIAEKDEFLQNARAFGEHLGLSFQIRDDVLDVTGNFSALGKKIGSDQENGKSTFVSLLGVKECEKLIESETCSALYVLHSTPFWTDEIKNMAVNLKNRNA